MGSINYLTMPRSMICYTSQDNIPFRNVIKLPIKPNKRVSNNNNYNYSYNNDNRSNKTIKIKIKTFFFLKNLGYPNILKQSLHKISK